MKRTGAIAWVVIGCLCMSCLCGCGDILTQIKDTASSVLQAVVTDGNSFPAAPPLEPLGEEKPLVEGLTPLSKREYYGYALLAKEENGTALQTVYNRLAAGVEAMDEEINLNDSTAWVTVDQLNMVWLWYCADYPQHFWRNNGYAYKWDKNSGNVMSISPEYTMTKDERDTNKPLVEEAATAILTDLRGLSGEYERELAIHDAMATAVTYDKEAKYAYDVFGALAEGKAVCEGYAEAFQYLLHQAGIQCLIAVGTGNSELHGWNVVRIDGNYYFTDVTWDDTEEKDIPVMHTYFNLTEELLKRDHVLDLTSSYPLPPCTAIAANYHVKNGSMVETFSVQQIVGLLKKGKGTAEVYLAKQTPQEYWDWFADNSRAIADKIGFAGKGYDCSGYMTDFGIRITIK